MNVSTGDAARVLVVALWFVAGMICWPRTRRLAAIVLGIAASSGAALVFDAQTRGATASAWLFRIAGAATGLTVALVFILLVSLPTTRPSSVTRVIAIATAAISVVICALSFPRAARVPVSALVALLAAAGTAVAYGRYTRATPIEQRSMRWLGAALLATVAASLLVACAWMLGWHRHAGPTLIASTLTFPVALAAMTRPRLLTVVDTVVARLTSALAATALLTTVVAAVVVAHESAMTPDQRRLVGLTLAAFVVAAIARATVIERFNTLVARVAHGDRPAPGDTLDRFSSRLTRAVPLQELLEQLCESLRKSGQLESVEVWTLTNDSLATVAASPHRQHPHVTFDAKARTTLSNTRVSGGTWLDVWMPSFVVGRVAANVRVAPLVHGGEVLGVLACERSATGDPFTESFDGDLRELARNVSLALHNLRLDAALQASLVELQTRNAELVESRSRIVAAGDATRRQIERDLHDGAQQRLVAMAVKLRLTRDVLHEDLDGAVELLGEMSTDVTEAIAELRRLAHGIFPPLLVSGGIGNALAVAATRSPLPATVDCDGLGRYPLAVEAAVYFCCVEALQNAAKHAGPSAEVTVRAWQEHSTLCFEVADNGLGFDADTAARGHGFANMADRLGAIEGVLTVLSTPGVGSRISGRVPSIPLAPRT